MPGFCDPFETHAVHSFWLLCAGQLAARLPLGLSLFTISSSPTAEGPQDEWRRRQLSRQLKSNFDPDSSAGIESRGGGHSRAHSYTQRAAATIYRGTLERRPSSSIGPSRLGLARGRLCPTHLVRRPTTPPGAGSFQRSVGPSALIGRNICGRRSFVRHSRASLGRDWQFVATN